jgi:hypothetical protein
MSQMCQSRKSPEWCAARWNHRAKTIRASSNGAGDDDHQGAERRALACTMAFRIDTGLTAECTPVSTFIGRDSCGSS